MGAPQLEVAGGVATITLVDPGGMNALDAAYVAALRQVVAEADADPEVAVILLRAEARAFCAGGDVRWFAAGEVVHDGILGIVDDVVALIGTLHETPRITIAAVHGAVAGAGLGIALACDVVVAAEDTAFVTAYAKLGASPDLGVSAFLVRDVGYRRALELCILGEPLGAAEARELGLVNRVVAAGELDEHARELALRIVRSPRRAVATAKRLLRTAASRQLADHLGDELRSVADLSRTPEWAEGVRAFLEGREPQFSRAPSPD